MFGSVAETERTPNSVSHPREYRAWAAARYRSKTNRPGYEHVEFSPAWEKFADFYADMGRCPKGFELDRIDNTGNYEPGNCRWASHSANNKNKGNNRRISWGGVELCGVEWAEKLGITQTGFNKRVRNWGICTKTFTPKEEPYGSNYK